MRTLDKRTRVNRRRFLVGTGATAAGIGVTSGAVLLMEPRDAWAQSFKTLSSATAKTLIQMARDMYPHDRLGDQHYAKVIEPYDDAAAKDLKFGELLNQGAAGLDAAAQGRHRQPYTAIAKEADRVALLKAIERSPFFQKVRGDTVAILYNRPEVWEKLGYEGPSADKGGYINRGFDDIDWLKA